MFKMKDFASKSSPHQGSNFRLSPGKKENQRDIDSTSEH